MKRLESENKLKSKEALWENIYKHIKRNVKGKKKKITIRNIIGGNGYGGKREKKRKKRKKK